jgi:hypothetical protein
MLLLQDPVLPSVVAIVAGAPVRGSWWAHPRGKDIFRILNAMVADPDVLAVKLVAGKVTLLHRRLWGALLGVADQREPWQTGGLSGPARALLVRLDAGEVVEAAGPAVKELEQRVLARGEQVHSDSGKHLVRLSSWSAWGKRRKCAPCPPAVARQMLTEALVALGGAPALLPWNRPARARRVAR